MRPLALLALLLAGACASNDGFVDESASMCAPGQDISMQAGFDNASSPGLSEQYTLIVEIANNSHDAITVKSVRADTMGNRDGNVEIQGGRKEFDKTIEGGDASLFEVPITVRERDFRSREIDPRRQGGAVIADLTVTAELSDGDSFRCRFRVPLYR
jgi:hypothetical protein